MHKVKDKNKKHNPTSPPSLYQISPERPQIIPARLVGTDNTMLSKHRAAKQLIMARLHCTAPSNAPVKQV